MGIIRTILALSVVFSHTIGFVVVGGQLAVQLFYLISGFLISFIIFEAKTYNSVKNFYWNRFLRLFPLYWLVAILTLGIYAAMWAVGFRPAFFTVFTALPAEGQVALTIANILILGQDWVMFTGLVENSLRFVTDFRDSDPPVYLALLVPQAWSLGLELSFYILAPFILASRLLTLMSFALSVCIKVTLFKFGLGLQDPWSHRFFPAELCLFLLGAISHQWIRSYCFRLLGPRIEAVSSKVTWATLLLCMFYFLLPKSWLLPGSVALIAYFVFCLPFLFSFQISRPWDAKVGELSYPLYISHMMIVIPLEAIYRHYYDGQTSRLFMGIVCVPACLLAALLLNHFIGDRMEVLRNRFRDGRPVVSSAK